MKIAITKIGANITFSQGNKSAAMADIKYALRTLGVHDNEITICSHRTRNTVIPKPLQFSEISDITDFNDFDCVLVFNGSINFFGGAEDPNLIALYKALNKTTKTIFYVQTDGQLPFKKLWPLIHKRDWAQKYTEQELMIPNQNVIYLTQGHNKVKNVKFLSSKEEHIVPKAIEYYPWERTILHGHEKWFNKPVPDTLDREYDLGFGGATRNTYKRKLIEKYYDSPKLKTLLFGNLRGVNVSNTEIKPKVSYQEVVPLMKKCKATVIIGDELYNDNFHTLRMYEAILAGNLVFIHKAFDPCEYFYDCNFSELYVESLAEVELMLNNLDPNVLQKTAEEARRFILNTWNDVDETNKLNDLIGKYL